MLDIKGLYHDSRVKHTPAQETASFAISPSGRPQASSSRRIDVLRSDAHSVRPSGCASVRASPRASPGRSRPWLRESPKYDEDRRVESVESDSGLPPI